MADRGISAGTLTALGTAGVEFYHLISIDFSTPVYYTTAPYDIDFGGNTYLSSGQLVSLPDIKESLKIRPETITIELSGAVSGIFALLLTEPKNVEVNIYRYVVSTAEAITLFTGYTDDYTTTENSQAGKTKVAIKVANHWADWESQAGRWLTDQYQQDKFPGDLGLEYLPVVDFFTQYWGQIGWFSERLYTQEISGGYYLWAWNNEYFINQFEEAKQADFEVQKLPIIYGEAMVSGLCVFRTVVDGAGAGYADEMWEVYALSEGICDSLVDVFFEDGTSYTDAKYTGKVAVYFKDGTNTQAALTELVTASTLWTNAHQLKGICYVAIRYTYDENLWTTNPNPRFQVKGKKLYDPRTTLNTWSANPVLVMYDYLTRSDYGKGVSATMLESINSDATYAETLVTDHDAGDGGTPVTIELLTFNGVIDTKKSVKENMEKILFCCRGYLTYVAGKYKLVVEKTGETSVYSFDETNIARDFKVNELSIKELANEFLYSFLDADRNYTKDTITLVSSTYQTLDGRILKKSVNNKYENNRYRADNRANTELKRTRENIVVDIDAANADALQIETGDIVDITRSVQGWTNKLFRVVQMVLGLNGDVKLSLNEYESTVFSWNISAERNPPVDTDLQSPFIVPAPTNLVLESGTNALLLQDDGTIISRIKASWTPVTDVKIEGYRIDFRHSLDTEYTKYAEVNKEVSEIYIHPVEDGETYFIRVYSMGTLDNLSTTVLQDSELVIGKTQPPADVASLSAFYTSDAVILKWDQVADLDLAGYEIRYGDLNTGCCWDAATHLTEVTRGTNITTVDVPPGNWTFYIKAVDTSGNYSVNTASTTLNVLNDREIINERYENRDWNWIGGVVDNPDNILVNNQDLSVWTKNGTPTVVEDLIDFNSTFYGRLWDVTDNSATVQESIEISKTTEYTHGQEWTAACYVNYLAGNPICAIELEFENGAATSICKITLNMTTGAVVTSSTNVTITVSGSENPSGWFLYIAGYSTTTGTDTVTLRLIPRDTAAQTGTASFEVPTLVRGQWDTSAFANFVVHPNGLVPKSMSLASLNGWNVFDMAVVDPYTAGKYRTQDIQLNFDSNRRVWSTTLHRLMTLEAGKEIEYINKYFDHHLWGAAGNRPYDGMELWEIGFAEFGQGMFEMIVGFGGGKMVIEEYISTMDAPLKTLKGSTTTVASINNTVTFLVDVNDRFHVAPIVQAIVNGSSAEYAVVRNITATSFQLAVFNSSGAAVAANVDWVATGV